MKRTIALTTTFALCCFTAAEAQTFLDRLQTNVEGQGVVTVHQDSTISELVLDPQSTLKPNDRKPQGGTTATPPKRQVTPNDTTTTTTTTPTPPRTRRTGGAYKIQAFAGGNNREDRKRAERVAAAIRAKYPNVAVSAHFYPPRWICYVGGYRTREEAEPMLQAIKNLGYHQALIVRLK